ncbi:hypothetical protein Tco_1326705 [Tanacetum coccineum]
MTKYLKRWMKCLKGSFIRGEVVAGSAEMVCPSQGDKGYVRSAWTGGAERARNRGGPREARRNMGVYTPYPRKDTFTLLTKTPKEILAMESISFPKPPPLIRTPEKQNLNKFYDYHKDRGSSSEIMYEHCFRNLGVNIRSRLRRCKISMIGFSGETYHPLGVTDLRVTLGKEGRNKTVLMEFAIIKCLSPYNSILGRTEMRSLGAVGSTIHSMIKFPTNQGVVTMETSREALQECKHLERVQGSWKEVQWRQREEQMSRIREQVILRTKSNSVIGPTSDPMSLERAWGRDNEEEAFTFSHELLDQYVTMGTTLTTNYTQLLVDVLRENREVFAWTGAERTTVPRFIMEHQLRIYPFAKHVVHKRRPMASEGRLEFKEKVFHWLKE